MPLGLDGEGLSVPTTPLLRDLHVLDAGGWGPEIGTDVALSRTSDSLIITNEAYRGQTAYQQEATEIALAFADVEDIQVEERTRTRGYWMLLFCWWRFGYTWALVTIRTQDGFAVLRSDDLAEEICRRLRPVREAVSRGGTPSTSRKGS